MQITFIENFSIYVSNIEYTEKVKYNESSTIEFSLFYKMHPVFYERIRHYYVYFSQKCYLHLFYYF